MEICWKFNPRAGMFQGCSYLERCCFGGGVISYNNKLTWSTKNQHMQHARSFLIGPSHQLLKFLKGKTKGILFLLPGDGFRRKRNNRGVKQRAKLGDNNCLISILGFQDFIFSFLSDCKKIF